jgi:glutamyl-tRNA synthetase
LRIEDTDRERSTQAAVDAILESLDWLGLDCDEGPFYQTHRFARYLARIDELLDKGLAYRCYCSKETLEGMREGQRARGEKPRYDGRCRERTGLPPSDVAPVVRFKNPEGGEVLVDDLIRGPIRFANRELDDLVIARPDGTPTYNFTVVVDDLEMAITHVIRGDDHINNTPRQMNIFRALDAEPPAYAHVPMILGPDGQRLSKRHGAVGVMQFKEEGYLPRALLNYLVRLGWSHGDREVFSLEEMIALFDVKDVNRAPASFDVEKLQWLNQQYLKTSPPGELAEGLTEQLRSRGIDPAAGPAPLEVVKAQRERAKTLKEMAENSGYFYADFDRYEEKAAAQHLRPDIRDAMSSLMARLAALDDWRAETLHELISALAEERGMKLGKLAQPLRVAVTGRSFSPPVDVTLELIGKERALRRLGAALEFIGKSAMPSSLTGSRP